MDDTQIMLVELATYYQSIYEMPPKDRPPEEIISDDNALQLYMEDLSRRSASQ